MHLTLYILYAVFPCLATLLSHKPTLGLPYAYQPSDGLASSADMGLGRSSVEEQKRWLRARSLVARVLHRLVNLASTSVPPPVDAAQQPQTTSKGPPGKAGGVKAKNAKAKAFNELANPAQATATSTLDKSAFLTSAVLLSLQQESKWGGKS